MVPIMKSVLIVTSPIKFMIPKSFAVRQWEMYSNCLLIALIFSGFIFGNKDQNSPWQTELLLNWKLPLKTLDILGIRLPKLWGALVSLTKVSLFFLASSKARLSLPSLHCYSSTILILNSLVLEGTTILIKNTV